MSERNPVIDPRPGDELRGDPWRYRVLENDGEEVRYQALYGTLEYIATVSLSGWRDMAAGLVVEKTA